MSASLGHGGSPRLWIGDTGVLLNEVVQGVRRDHLTSLVAALHHHTARLFVARHVLVEMERNLPGFAASRHVDAARAVEQWHGLYLPYTFVVDVPDSWCEGDPRIAAVAQRHPTDLPTARLAAAVAPCHGLISDPDLTDYGFGNDTWLQLAHASANRAEMELLVAAARFPVLVTIELVKAAVRTTARLPSGIQMLLAVAGAIGLSWWQRTPPARGYLERGQAFISDVATAIEPLVADVAQRDLQAHRTWNSNVVTPGHARGLSEELARLLAVSEPMRADELAREIAAPGTVRERTARVRAELRQSSAFIETRRGGWQLGARASECASGISPQQVADWLQRAHPRLGASLIWPRPTAQ